MVRNHDLDKLHVVCTESLAGDLKELFGEIRSRNVRRLVIVLVIFNLN